MAEKFELLYVWDASIHRDDLITEESPPAVLDQVGLSILVFRLHENFEKFSALECLEFLRLRGPMAFFNHRIFWKKFKDRLQLNQRCVFFENSDDSNNIWNVTRDGYALKIKMGGPLDRSFDHDTLIAAAYHGHGIDFKKFT